MSGDTRTSRYLVQIARALETSPEYLLGETDDPSPHGLADRRLAFHGPAAEDSDTVDVPQIDFAYGLGGSFLDSVHDDVPVQAETMRFSRAWLRHFTKSDPDQLYFASGAGDSMMPTIHDQDLVLIDRSQDTIRAGDKIWAIAFGGVGMIKRLRPRPDGSVAILSDNEHVPEDRATDDELFIIGRVVAVVRRI